MEPSSPGPPIGPPILNSCQNRNTAPIRKPLISIKDIEKRLVFTKNIKPFALSEQNRQWIFGSELSKLEGKQLKQYWVMLFNDILLFTSVNRDRVFYVMDDPLILEMVSDTVFNVKRKATEFRLILEKHQEYLPNPANYLSKNSDWGSSLKNSSLTKGKFKKSKPNRPQTLVLRAPNVELKSTWENLLSRQIALCKGSNLKESKYKIYGKYFSSLPRASSQDGVLNDSLSTDIENRSESCDDLRPSDDFLCRNIEETLLNTTGNKNIDIDKDPEENTSYISFGIKSNTSLKLTPECASFAKDDERKIEKADDRIAEEEVKIDNVDKNVEEDAEDEDFCLERIRLAERSRAKENRKSFGGKFREKLFSNKGHLPKKSINRAKKVERYVNSLRINEFDINRSVTPLFEHEDLLNEEDFIEKRKEMLKNKKKNCFECEEIIILESGKSTPIPNQNITESFTETKENLNDINMSCDQIIDEDENICDSEKKSNFTLRVSDNNGSNSTLKGKETLISPEGYEEYLDGEIEEDYPELKSISSSLKSEEQICVNGSDSNENLESENCKTLEHNEVQIHITDKNLISNEDTLPDRDCRKRILNENAKENSNIDKQDPNLNLAPEVKNISSEEPLSGSSSMSFMDETTPTSLDENYDFYQTATKAAIKAESLAEKRGLKSYGSSCDLSKFGLSSPSDKEEDPDLKNNNEINCNFPVKKLSSKVSKIGGTKSGSFVAKKLAVFEKVVKEERKKYLESHEARMRKQYSGEFNSKVLQPQNPDVLRVQEKDYISYCDARENNNPYLEYRRSSSPFIFRDDGNTSSFLNLSSNRNENLNTMKTERRFSVESIGKMKRQNEEENERIIDRTIEDFSEPPDNSEDFKESSDFSEDFNKDFVHDISFDILEPSTKISGTLKSSLKKTDVEKSRSCTSNSMISLSPDVLRVQSTEEEDSQTSPSRVRFSPVTDIFIRESYSSSSAEDDGEDDEDSYKEEDSERDEESEDEDGLRNYSVDSYDAESEEDNIDECVNKNGFQDIRNSPKVCPKEILMKSFGDGSGGLKTDQNEGETRKTSKKRFSLFRVQRKDEEPKTQSVNPIKGKRTIFKKSKTKNRSLDNSQRTPNKSEPISEEEFV